MNQRDLEILSSYLDGQISRTEVVRLQTRLESDPELASALSDLRSARALLKKLPKRKAPRNFTLTRKMVGLNPPMPRSYFSLRLVTAFATFLLFASVGVNTFAPSFASPSVVGFGAGGGGGDPSEFSSSAEESFAVQATELPAPAADAPAMAPAEPAPTQESEASASSLAPEATPPSVENSAEDSARKTEEQLPIGGGLDQPNSVPAEKLPPPISQTWQIGLLALAGLSALAMLFIRRRSASRWK